jgi:hypothetical protein
VLRGVGQEVVAAYFDGSLALGDFDPSRSDVDLLIVTRRPIRDLVAGRIADIHASLASDESAWAGEIEVIYVSIGELTPAAVPGGSLHSYVERGTGGLVRSAPLDPGWLLHLRVLRRHGIPIFGPSPRDLVSPVADDDLRRAVSFGATARLGPYCDDPRALEPAGARAFAVLTACRILHTLRTGEVVPKMEAARSARSTVDASLAAVIGAAMAWRKHDLQLDATVEGTAALLRLVQGRCAAWERRFDAAGTRVFPTPTRRE